MSNNKFCKPLKFKTVEELQKKIDDYFYSCDEESEPITITGLALALDTTRETLCDYEEKDAYSDTIKKAKLRVQHAYEKRLVKRGNGGDIFALKNFGWKDKSEVDNTLNIKSAFVEFNDGTSEGYDTDKVQTSAN
ncbi:MAG: hypothetical protein IJS26_05540 [Alphaproteobacteria bacterium]|nr:hypothetical protein [Alphaproteobacteria bacterium]